MLIVITQCVLLRRKENQISAYNNIVFTKRSKMEYMKPEKPAQAQLILCCECGTLTPPNPANMCPLCVRTRVDISENIPKQVYVGNV